MQNHLTRRGAMYYYRRRIPIDLLQHFSPKKEITKALGTSDRREAERLARALAVKHDDEFQTIRATQAAPATAPASSCSAFDIKTIDLGFSEEENNGQILSEHAPSFETLVATEAAHQLEQLKRAILHHRLTGNLQDFMTLERLRFVNNRAALEGREESHYPTWKLRAVVLAQQEVFEPGQHLPIKWLNKTQQAPSTQVAKPATSTGESVLLEKLVELWQKDRNPTNARTVLKAELVARRFVELQGDHPVHEITKKQCIAFRDALRADGQSIPNTNSYTDKLRALFSVAQARDIIKENPAAGLALKDPTPRAKKRLPFDAESLVKVFSSPIYTAGERPKGGAGEAAYWLPLLSLFTGARLEELGQLTPDDVREESYDDGTGNRAKTWVIRLTDSGENQGLKNAASARRVPLHAELIRLKFVEFAKTRNGKTRLFFELRPDTKGVETGLWSKWFGRWLRETCKVDDPRIVFHSFRHTFKDLCRAAEIEEAIHDALTGHSGNPIARSYGSDQYPLRPLVQAIQKLRLPTKAQSVISAILGS